MGLGFPCSYPQKVSRFKALFTSSIHTHIWLLFYLSPSYGQDILWMFSSQVVPSTRNRASLTLRNATWPWLNDKWMTPESKALTFCCTTESSVAETSPAAMSSPWSFFFPSSSHPGLILSLDTSYHLSSIDPLRVSSAPVKKNRTPSHSSKGRFALMCSGLLLDHQSGHLCSLYPSDQTLTQSCLDFAGLESKSLLWWLCIPLRLIIKWYPYIDMWGIWIFFSHFPRIFLNFLWLLFSQLSHLTSHRLDWLNFFLIKSLSPLPWPPP